MARQDFQGRENTRKKAGEGQGGSQTRKKQHTKCIDELEEPQGSTQMNRNGII